MEQAIAGFERRKANTPKVTYAEELPVSERRDEIIEAIRANQVVIVCGETGSGKTPDRGTLGRGAHRRGTRGSPWRSGRFKDPVF